MSAKYKSPSFLLPNELNTSTSPSLSEDRASNYSMHIDTAGQGIATGSLTDLGISTTFSFSIWVNLSAFASSYMHVLSTGFFNTAGFALWVKQDSGNYYWSFYVNGYTTNVITDTTAIVLNQWYHIAVSWDNTTGAKMYINGGSPITGLSGITLGNLSKNIAIGAAFSNTFQYPINGQIDEVAIFNKSLTSTDITSLYNSGSPASSATVLNLGAVAYYPLGEQAQMQGYLGNEASSEWQFPNGVLQDYVMDFNGTDNYIDTNLTIDSTYSALTISAWVNFDNLTSHSTVLGQWRNGSFANSTVLLYLDNTGKIQTLFGSGSSYVSAGLNTTLQTNRWYNLIVLWDGSTVKLYVDGYVQPTTGSLSSLNNSDVTLKIGSYNEPTGSGTRNYIDGKISNVVVWKSDQSANIANIYNNGSPQTSYTVTPQNWWKLNADSVYTPSAPNYTKALDFVASELDYIDVGNPTDLQITGELSISVWVKFTGNTAPIISKYESGSAVRPKSYILEGDRAGSNNSPIFSIYNSGTIYSTPTSVKVVDDGDWHHLVGVFNPSNYLRLYIDGVLEQENTSVPASIDNDPADFVIGAVESLGTPVSYFNGQLSNAAIFNSALTSSQVSTLFNFGTPETNISFDPVAWWKLDDQNAITDYSGNGNTGTNNGATDISSAVAVTPSWKIPSALTIPTINYTTALDFNRSEYDNLNTTAVTDFDTGDVSFSVWVFKDDSSTTGIVFSNSFDSGDAGITVSINNLERVLIKRSTRTHSKSTGHKNFGFTTNKWHQIAFTYNDSTHTLRTFLDGQFKQEWSVPSATLAASTDFCVGGRGPGATSQNIPHFFDGKISNLTIFNSKLEDSDIDTLYNNGQPLSDLSSFTTLATWWKLDNLTTGIQDSVGSINLTNDGATQVTSDVYAENIPVNGVSTTLPSTALQQSDLQFDSPYSNYSLSFDQGSSSFVNCSEITQLQGASVITWNCWVNFATANQNIVFGKHLTTTNDAIQFYTWGSGVGYFWLKTAGSAVTASINPFINSLVNLNEWSMFSIVFDGTQTGNDRLKIYLNGGSTNIITGYNGTVPATLPNTTDDFYIGRGYDGYFDGKIDEFSIFNYALSFAQLLEIYNNGRPKDLTTFSGTSPISWWRLGENAYFDNNSFVAPNSISGAPNGTGSGSITTMISGDAPGTYANGIGTNLDILDRVGDAPLSTSNSQSYNMIPDDKVPYVPGYVGNQIANNFSMTFDAASNTYFNAGNLSAINGLQKVTYSFWMNDSSGGASYPIGTDGQLILMPLINSNRFDVYLNGTSSSARIYNNQTLTILNTNQWHHIVLVVDSTLSTANQRTKLYIDGNSYTDVSGTPITQNATIGTVTTDTNIGRASGSVPAYFSGKLDEVAIFDTALNAGQIYNDIYQPSLPAGSNKTADIANNPNLPNPVAWYRMGD